MRDEFSKHRCLGQEYRRLLEAAEKTVSRSFLCLRLVVSQSVLPVERSARGPLLQSSGASSITARRAHLHSLPDSNHPAAATPTEWQPAPATRVTLLLPGKECERDKKCQKPNMSPPASPNHSTQTKKRGEFLETALYWAGVVSIRLGAIAERR